MPGETRLTAPLEKFEKSKEPFTLKRKHIPRKRDGVAAIMCKVKNVGKPYAGKLHVRFDEGGAWEPVLYSTETVQKSHKYAESGISERRDFLYF